MTTMSAVYKYGYSPIEQLTNGMKQGPFTDIYALCATIYEMLTGTIPPSPFTRYYEGDNLVPPSAMGVQIYPVQEEALMRGLAVRGEDRVQSIEELRTALCGVGVAGTEMGAQGERQGGVLPVILAGAAAFLSVLLIFMIGSNLLAGKKKPQAGSQTIAQAEREEEQPQEQEPLEEQPQEEQQAEQAEQAEETQPQTGQHAESIQQIAQQESGPDDRQNVPEGATRISNPVRLQARLWL